MSELTNSLVVADAHGEKMTDRKTVYVYEAPVRIWHWVNALAIVVLGVTGYFIGSPLASQPGEASDHFLMGYIRFAHFSAGYILAVGFLMRLYWAFVGNTHAKQLFYIPIWKKSWRQEVLEELKWYLFLVKNPKRYVGHNPLANAAMFILFTLTTIFMIVTGFALYSEGAGLGSWQSRLFGWVFGFFPNSQDVHTLHHLGLWVLVIFIILHVYAAIREDIMSRQSMISTMISGERHFRGDDER
jgi:Ni/Fe-hydrogenase 1 B-type cytochrome subunit